MLEEDSISESIYLWQAVCGRSAVEILNNVGVRTDPCKTPLTKKWVLECLLQRECEFLVGNHFNNHRKDLLGIALSSFRVRL